MNDASGNVVFCGPFDDGPGYPRPAGMRAALQELGIAVQDCRLPGLGRRKQSLWRQPWRWPGLWLSQRRHRRELRQRLAGMLAAQRPRCVLVPYPGHFAVREIAAIAHAAGVPVILDLFFSLYDTVVEDRALVAPGSLLAHWLQRVDTAACAAADLVLLDTPANAAYAASLTGLPAERFGWLPLLDPAAPATPSPLPPMTPGQLQLLFFGTGVPLHGLRHLLAAVAQTPGVVLTLVGGSAQERQLASALPADRLRLLPEFVARERLQELLAASQLVAGVFGDSGKAQRVVPWKVVHALAAGRPVLTADTPAVSGWLEGSGAVLTVPPADAAALAACLRSLVADPQPLVAAAAAARGTYERHFGRRRGAERWRAILQRCSHAPAGAA
jgi:sugar/nucleoside kinase (ribokinase family)